MTIEWFDTGRPDVSTVGGKGASLIEMRRHGLPVPSGFCITADVYQRFSRAAQLERHLPAINAQADLATAQSAADAVAPLLAQLQHATLDSADRREITDAYRTLRGMTAESPLVAVRSSALSEDGAAVSSAGIYDTFLNLANANDVLAAVVDCFRALWAPRAMQYRATQGIAQSSERMAVVVMEMVQASVAGVAFSANPVTGNHDEVVINASWGLGESVVGGRVTPDNVVAAKSDGSITTYDLGDKATEVVVDPQSGRGAIERPVPPDRAARRCLSDADVHAIVDLARRAEQYYGGPQDIEFAFANSRRYLLQTRPITGLR